MNLASNCRYMLRFPLLCRKWVWLSLSLSSLEWKSMASYYCSVLLSQQMLPAIRHVASDTFVFQQDNASSRRARTPLNSYSKKRRTSVVLMSGRQTAQTWIHAVDYKVWDVMQQRVYECRMNSVDELKLRLIDVWNSLQQNVKSNWEHACMQMDNNLNICCERVWLTKVRDK